MRVSAGQEDRPNIPARFYYQTNPVVEYRNPFADRPLNYADEWGASDIIAIADALASIHSAVAAKFAPAYGIAQARRDQELSIAIGHSASLDGAPVRLPLKEETPWERAQHEKFRTRWGGDPFKDVEKLTAQNFSGKSPG